MLGRDFSGSILKFPRRVREDRGERALDFGIEIDRRVGGWEAGDFSHNGIAAMGGNRGVIYLMCERS